jgi:hypothetical protein
MNAEQASQVLLGRQTVPVMQGSIRAVKELHAKCLEAGIPAAMARPCTKGGG